MCVDISRMLTVWKFPVRDTPPVGRNNNGGQRAAQQPEEAGGEPEAVGAAPAKDTGEMYEMADAQAWAD